MEELEYSLKLAQRKEKAETQAKKYFYEVKRRKACIKKWNSGMKRIPGHRCAHTMPFVHKYSFQQ